jgi:hypothetical protein
MFRLPRRWVLFFDRGTRRAIILRHRGLAPPVSEDLSICSMMELDMASEPMEDYQRTCVKRGDRQEHVGS